MGLSRAVHTNHAKKAAEKLRLEKNGEIGKPTFNAVKNEGYRARTGRVDNTNKKKPGTDWSDAVPTKKKPEKSEALSNQ